MKISLKLLIKSYSFILVGFVSQNIYAISTISAPEEIVVLAINDQVIKTGLLRNAKNYKVNPGATSLSVRYQEYFENGIGQHDIVKSNIINIAVPELKDNQNYVLKLVNAPQDYDEAKKYSSQPNIAIFDSKNQIVTQKTGMVAESKGSLLDGLFGNSVDLTQSKTTSSQVQVLNAPMSNSSVVTSKTVSNTTSPSSLSSDQQLIQIWQGASKSERQKFMSWLAEQ